MIYLKNSDGKIVKLDPERLGNLMRLMRRARRELCK